MITPDIWYIRHGESEGNTLEGKCPVGQDTPLTPLGKQQAETITTHFKQHNTSPDIIFTSTRLRCQQTAQILHTGLGLPASSIITLPQLDERNWGNYGNKPWEDLLRDILSTMSLEERYSFTPPNGESWQTMEQRLISAQTQIVTEAQSGKTVAVVSHRGVYRALLPILAGVDKSQHESFSLSIGGLARYSPTAKTVELVNISPDFSPEF